MILMEEHDSQSKIQEEEEEEECLILNFQNIYRKFLKTSEPVHGLMRKFELLSKTDKVCLEGKRHCTKTTKPHPSWKARWRKCRGWMEVFSATDNFFSYFYQRLEEHICLLVIGLVR